MRRHQYQMRSQWSGFSEGKGTGGIALVYGVKSYCHVHESYFKKTWVQRPTANKKKTDHYQTFPPSSFLWPGATEQCVSDEHEGASSKRRGPPCHWHGSSKPAAATLHHWRNTSLARTPRRGRHIQTWGAEVEAEDAWLNEICTTGKQKTPLSPWLHDSSAV